jgi:uncharacterized membrane protein
MRVSLVNFVRVFKLVFIVASPFAIHFILVRDPSARGIGVATGGLVLGQAALVCSLICASVRPPFRLPAVAIVVAGGLGLCLLHLHSGLVLSSGAPHAVSYAGLLFIFGASLLPGREPIITYFARAIHGDLSIAIEEYTRRVTWGWCVFFALQLVGSAFLLLLAPIAWWSAFVNLLNVPFIALVLLGERLTRSLWIANPPKDNLGDFLRMPGLLRQNLKTLSAE